MSAGELRTLRRRIRSVQSTQKITRAMELIAASRITRARAQVEATRPYAQMITRVMRDLAAEHSVADHPLLAQREPSSVGVLVITSDRGLAGAYNANVLRRADRLAEAEQQAGRQVRRYAIGRKAETYYRYRGEPLAAGWTGMSDQPGYLDAQRAAERLMDDFTAERIDRVWLCFTSFRSALSQVTQTVRLLPVEAEQMAGGREFPPQYLFEPEPGEILARLVPRYVEHRLYAGLLESAASEHASRQRAMKAATDNAGEMIENLTREANRARQAAITTEISEIVGGAEALASAS